MLFSPKIKVHRRLLCFSFRASASAKAHRSSIEQRHRSKLIRREDGSCKIDTIVSQQRYPIQDRRQTNQMSPPLQGRRPIRRHLLQSPPIHGGRYFDSKWSKARETTSGSDCFLFATMVSLLPIFATKIAFCYCCIVMAKILLEYNEVYPRRIKF